MCTIPFGCVASPSLSVPSNRIAIAVQGVSPDTDVGELSDEVGLGFELGRDFSETDAIRFGIESRLSYAKHDYSAVIVTGGPVPEVIAESPTSLALGLGVRATLVLDDPRLQPFARLGAQYQHLVDDIVDDSGAGFYVGAGFDYRLTDGISLGPFIEFSSVALDRADVNSLTVGAALSARF